MPSMEEIRRVVDWSKIESPYRKNSPVGKALSETLLNRANEIISQVKNTVF